MKILFVTSEHPSRLLGGLGTFTREYVKELRKHTEVYCVYFHLSREPLPEPDETVDLCLSPRLVFEAFSPEARILEAAASFRSQLQGVIEKFKPDIIHCNDRQTFLPFRFDKNVFYSSHLIFTDLLGDSVLDDIYFQEVKVERCALEESSVLGVYSDFAAKSAEKLSGGLCTPVVLPLGLRVEKFLQSGKDFLTRTKNGRKLRVSFFGRFENMQKGIYDFIYAVNLLGEDFKKQNNVEYSLYGYGTLNPAVDTRLFDNIGFLKGEKLFDAYKKSDIVVMPSRYEPFGFTGLEAMASGALVLLPSGLGMDMYAENNRNCLEIPHDIKGISEVLSDAVLNLDKYRLLRENAVMTARDWTWERCVKAHLYIYSLMMKGKSRYLSSAFRTEERSLVKKYEKSSDVEKIYAAEKERRVCELLIREMHGKGGRILFLTGVYAPEKESLPENVEVFSVLNEGKDGLVVRPECLPFDEKEFDYIFACGSWETVLDPLGSLIEMERSARKGVTLLYFRERPHSWQTFQMEGIEDFEKFSSSEWNLAKCEGNLWKSLSDEYGYEAVSFVPKALSSECEITA